MTTLAQAPAQSPSSTPITAQPDFVPKFPPAAPVVPAPAPPAPTPLAPAPQPAVVQPAPPTQPAVVQPAPPTQPAVVQPAPAPIPAGAPGWVLPAALIGAALVIGVLAFVLWRRSQRIAPEEIFRVLDIDPESAGTEHVEFPPIDLHQPIFGEAAWRAIRTHADDAAYLSAVEVVRQRHGDTGHPMALANLLRETMAAERIGFREAILRLGGETETDDPDAPRHGPVLDEDGRVVEPDAPAATEAGSARQEAAAGTPQDGAMLPGRGRIFDVEEEAFVPGPLAPRGAPEDDGGTAEAARGAEDRTGWVVDLARPIGREEWEAILADAGREGYLDAAQTVQARYRTVIDRMLLPNTLRRLIEDERLGFAEAMRRAATVDPLRPPAPRA